MIAKMPIARTSIEPRPETRVFVPNLSIPVSTFNGDEVNFCSED